MARTARQKLVSLHIPETDPAWKHVTYRSTTNKATSAPSVSLPAAGSSAKNSVSTDGPKLGPGKVSPPRRGVSSKEVKEKKAKPRPDSKSEIQMKDESLRATPRTSNVIEQASHPSTPITSLRKTPGSGFRMGKSTTPQDLPSHTTTTEHVLARSKLVDAQAIRNKEPALSTAKPLHRNPHPTNPDRKVVPATQSQHIWKVREDASGGTDPEREKHADHARALRREKARTREHGGIEGYPQDEDASALKRKKVIRDNVDYDASSSRSASQKKRKMEDGMGPAFTSAGEDLRAKNLSLPKKPELTAAARPRVKKEPSPSPHQTSLPRIKRDGPRTSLSTQGKSSTRESTPPSPNLKRDDSRAAHKTRRRSPIYTSSEDERSFHSPRRAGSIGPLPTPPMTTHHASPAVPAANHARNQFCARDTLPLPTNRAELRARYSASYLEYLSKLRTLVAQKGKIDSMLKSNDVVGAGSITDSDGDVEVMDSEELAQISSEYKLLEEELERIRLIFSRSEGEC
jgi:RNA polymerase II elongation factor ELL